MDPSETALKPGARWDPASYELNDFDFDELAEMFAEIRAGCGQNFSRYFVLLKRFVKLSITNCELDLHAKKLLSAELMSVHERFVNRILQICKLPVKTRSLDDILNGDDEKSPNDKLFLPHISTLNALVIIYSLGCGWSAPDRAVGEILAEAVHTMLKDRIDAALSVRNVPIRNEIGIHARYEPSSGDAGQSTSGGVTLTASDFLKSFSCKNHFLANDSLKLLRLRSHSNFYKRLKSVVSQDEWDAALEESLLDNSVKRQEQDDFVGEQSSSKDFSIDETGNESASDPDTVGSGKAVKRPSSSIPQPAKRKYEKSSSNSVADTSSISCTAVDTSQNG